MVPTGHRKCPRDRRLQPLRHFPNATMSSVSLQPSTFVFQTALGNVPETERWRRTSAALENVERSKVAASWDIFKDHAVFCFAANFNLFQTALVNTPEREFWRRKSAGLETVPKIDGCCILDISQIPCCLLFRCNFRSLGHFLQLPFFFSSTLSLAYVPRLFETRLTGRRLQ